MASILDSVDQRTQLVGENRLELLMFRLGSRQLFAINVFKVREVVKLPHLNKMPGSHHNISGVANIRGVSIPVIDLRSAIGMRGQAQEGEANLIITEYNRTIQGFLVGQVANIANMTWKDILPPPRSAGRANYLTAITRLREGDSEQIVEIIDVEKVLAEIITYDIRISDAVLDRELLPQMQGRKVLIVDDSSTARNLIRDTLAQLGLEVIECQDGLQALRLLKSWCDAGKRVTDEILLMITDAEMPEMDGYRLTHEVRSDPRMQDLFITLNTSLSGNFNEAMVKKVGCDRFISKFQPDLLVGVAQERLRQLLG
ncbi:chemotaxis protein CheV [Aeromonas rivuli]|jgi:two-component system, chemotaxis family, chemotaxis protein CheV|uniref:chemotaxis protein CheV n=1 Tax=Aeromonas TaxID=642 RepID=UPI0005A74324|nr:MULTISPECIES: chemotaxis protein CheV [Aeromonas]MCS3457717.1 two-component system chemotaxis response regulator CheV [Aeromonas sp. BIGb0405]MCS3461737.1 two-component system chemotaxis response regulator CheV [Aeromonas sp. BIGb0445]UBO74798.1 chemotaxis protein CheV [Aeromonas rivuli]